MGILSIQILSIWFKKQFHYQIVFETILSMIMCFSLIPIEVIKSPNMDWLIYSWWTSNNMNENENIINQLRKRIVRRVKFFRTSKSIHDLLKTNYESAPTALAIRILVTNLLNLLFFRSFFSFSIRSVYSCVCVCVFRYFLMKKEKSSMIFHLCEEPLIWGINFNFWISTTDTFSFQISYCRKCPLEIIGRIL